MTKACVSDRARIIVGSQAQFSLFLTNEDGRCVSLSPYNAGNLVFCNCAGVRTVIALTIPGANPDNGEIAVSIPSADAANADDKWVSADLELTRVSDGGTEVVLLNNKFEILKRNCPPTP